jgi:hypothetical protein
MKTSLICRIAAVVGVIALGLSFTLQPAYSATTNEVTLTGTLSCAHCQGIQPMHKGYTQFTWALHSVDLGDGIVLVSQNKVYTLEGDKSQLLPFMSAKARVTGHLDGDTLEVLSIHRYTAGE